MDIEINQRLISFILFLPVFLISLAVHEFAHAFIASKLGDNTAKDLGRLTLNPIKHLDLVGSIVMPVLSFLSGFMLIGWAKPVPVNPNNFKNPLLDDAKVAAAGPFSNLLLAFTFVMISNIIGLIGNMESAYLTNLLWFGVFFNIFLALFNLLPIPPLDGSHILFDLFPNKITAKIIQFGKYGTIILLVFIYSPLWGVFINAVRFVANIFEKFKVV